MMPTSPVICQPINYIDKFNTKICPKCRKIYYICTNKKQQIIKNYVK